MFHTVQNHFEFPVDGFLLNLQVEETKGMISGFQLSPSASLERLHETNLNSYQRSALYLSRSLLCKWKLNGKGSIELHRSTCQIPQSPITEKGCIPSPNISGNLSINAIPIYNFRSWSFLLAQEYWKHVLQSPLQIKSGGREMLVVGGSDGERRGQGAGAIAQVKINKYGLLAPDPIPLDPAT